MNRNHPQAKLLLTQALIQLGLQVVNQKPKQSLVYGQEAQTLLDSLESEDMPDQNIDSVKEDLAKLEAEVEAALLT